jgi:ribosomal protein S18 acetylase RimI-like enzyme
MPRRDLIKDSKLPSDYMDTSFIKATPRADTLYKSKIITHPKFALSNSEASYPAEPVAMPSDRSHSTKKSRANFGISSQKRQSSQSEANTLPFSYCFCFDLIACPVQANSSPDKPKPLPLVERTNALSLEEFVSLYIPSSELRFQKAARKEQDSSTSSPSRHDDEFKDAPTKAENLPASKKGPGAKEKSDASTATPTCTYTLDIHTAATIHVADLDACFGLIELTSSAAYKTSSMGWSPKEKRKEMKLPDMKYMILRRAVLDGDAAAAAGSYESEGSDFAGFLEYMVTYEDGYEVLYCYEIHLTPEVQGQGLGEELMARFERVGARIGLEKAMLTVFKSNRRAIMFYEKVGYTEDESSPRPRKLRNGSVKEADYMIMSKSLR